MQEVYQGMFYALTKKASKVSGLAASTYMSEKNEPKKVSTVKNLLKARKFKILLENMARM